MKKLLHVGAKFLLVGGLSTVIELACFNLFVLVFRWDPVAAKVVSSLIALVNAYIGNREWAFRHRRGRSRAVEAVFFVIVNAACTALGAAIVGLGVAILDDPHPLVLNAVNIFSIGIVVIVRFVLYHFVVFKPTPPPSHDGLMEQPISADPDAPDADRSVASAAGTHLGERSHPIGG